MLKSYLSIVFVFLGISLFSQIVNTGMTTNYDSLETGKISIGGYVDTYYGFDFSQPENSERAYSVSSSRHNEININFAPGEYNLVNSNMCKVPTALILKSLIILDLAQS